MSDRQISRMQPLPFVIFLADDSDRRRIYRARHEIYAKELGQHPANDAGELHDRLDDGNFYLVAYAADEFAGFVSVTPPGSEHYSVDKYFPRAALPFPVDDTVGEVRLLTVLPPHRHGPAAALLLYAALRWLEANGIERVMGIGRQEMLGLYRKAGLETFGPSARSGAVTYHLMGAAVGALRRAASARATLLARLQKTTAWRLPFAFRQPAACFHGGRFFGAVGERFDTLYRRAEVINADVLDAWFPPAPGVLAALHEHLPWLVRTSPPADGAGLVAALAAARGVRRANLLLGAGSSDLIFRALPRFLRAGDRVLLLDPTYGEYAHVLERVLGCRAERFPLRHEEGYAVNVERLGAALRQAYDLVVLVNPNSPTGRHVPRLELESLLRHAPASTRFWIDETYVDYLGAGESLEPFAAGTSNVIVCKSMSKVYALSGVRAAYLCANPVVLEGLRAYTPPWVVSLPAQVAAVRALADPGYYAARYRETHTLRTDLAAALERLGWEVAPGACANFLLCRLPAAGPDAAALTRACEARGLFLRDASGMGAMLGGRAVRIAVKDIETNARMLEILSTVTAGPG